MPLSSDTPQGSIARLDAALSRRGDAVTVRRYTSVTEPRTKTDVSGRAQFRIIAPEEAAAAGGKVQAKAELVISPTGLSSLLPLRQGDKVIRGGVEWNIDLPMPISQNGTTVRIDAKATGKG